jgi:hypothetical protein
MRVKFLILAVITAGSLARGQYGPIPPHPGMPFSADQIFSEERILPDGRHLTLPDRTSKLYRNSQGLTRVDQYFAPASTTQQAPPALMNITIFDSIAGAKYILNPAKKTAQKFPLDKALGGYGLTEMARALPGMIAAALNGTGGAPLAAHDTDDKNAPPSQNESLGNRNIEGLTAVGRRTTMTFPPGTGGYSRGFVTTFEAWESPDLGMMMVWTKHTDSRSGESTIRMTNVRRTEPDPSLFVVPADYTIQEITLPAR